MKNKILPIAVSVICLVAGILAGTLLPGGEDSNTIGIIKNNKGQPITPPELTEYSAEAVDYGYTFVPNIVSNIWFGNAEQVYKILENQKTKVVDGKSTEKTLLGQLDNALTELGSFSRYYDYEDQLCIEVDGVKYGAYVEEGEAPIGGGGDYEEIFTTGDYVVDTFSELTDAISKAQSGEVIFIEGHAAIDISSLVNAGKYLDLKPGVTLASNRGYKNEDGTIATGGRIYSSSMANKAIYASEGSRVTGLVITGGDPNQHLAHHARAFQGGRGGSSYYYRLTSVSTDGIHVIGNGVRVDNCELGGFGHAAVNLAPGVKDVLVQYCYIHHNQANGLGYGICHGNNTESIVEYCLFNYNRHSIAATGAPTTGYIARFNVEMGSSLSHCFDVHGGSDRGDGTNIAGTYCEMYNNTFLADTYPYWLRGIPEEYQEFHNNVVKQPLSAYNKGKLVADKVKMFDNIFGIANKTVVK